MWRIDFFLRVFFFGHDFSFCRFCMKIMKLIIIINSLSFFSLPQCIKVAISISILLTYALQFYVPIAIIWPQVVQNYGPFKYPVVGEIIFRTSVCFVTCKYFFSISNIKHFFNLLNFHSHSGRSNSTFGSFHLTRWCS